MADLRELLSKLKSLGNEKTRAHNAKVGAKEQFGVKLGDIRKLAEKVKVDHELGLELWDTGIADARLLGTLVMKPSLLSAKQLDELVKSITFSQEADWVNSYIVKDHPAKEELREKWMHAKNKWAARAGWSLTAGRVVRDPKGIDLEALLDRIETEMPTAPPEVQWTMNTTLAQIGIHFPKLRKRAVAIGETLGIYRDYPVSKGCTSPFAPIWIEEMVRRQSV